MFGVNLGFELYDFGVVRADSREFG